MSSSKNLSISVLCVFSILQSIPIHAQTGDSNWRSLFFESYYGNFRSQPPLRAYWMKLSLSNAADDMESLSYGIDAVVAMFEATDSTVYLDDAITLTNNVINRARITKDIPDNKFSLKDNYKGWVSEIPNGYQYQQETVLSEIYLFQYVTRLLKDINNNRAIFRKKNYKNFYNQTLDFIESNIWDKWQSRGIKYNGNKTNYLLLGRTHMACHWAYIAAELSFLTKSETRKSNYIEFVELYNDLLQKNLIKNDQYVYWDQVWDSQNGSDNAAKNRGMIQDVSHGNLVVSYLVEARDLGLWKDTVTINSIINTLIDKLWDPANCLFKDKMDGSMFEEGEKGSVGSFQADGFVKLTRYDKRLLTVYENFVSCSKMVTWWHQFGQLFANLALSETLLKKSP